MQSAKYFSLDPKQQLAAVLNAFHIEKGEERKEFLKIMEGE